MSMTGLMPSSSHAFGSYPRSAVKYRVAESTIGCWVFDKRLEERDRQLTQTLRLMTEEKQATQRKAWSQRIFGGKS
jgi:hypothetical protein